MNPQKVTDIDWNNWVARDRATLVFVIRGGKILLIDKKRGFGKGKINGPGGKVEPGETYKDCAVREAEEELGIVPLTPRLRAMLRFQFLDGYSMECAVFTSEHYEGEATVSDEATPRWTNLDEIPYDLMWADDAIWIPRMLAGENLKGVFVFDGDTMLDYRITSLD